MWFFLERKQRRTSWEIFLKNFNCLRNNNLNTHGMIRLNSSNKQSKKVIKKMNLLTLKFLLSFILEVFIKLLEI